MTSRNINTCNFFAMLCHFYHLIVITVYKKHYSQLRSNKAWCQKSKCKKVGEKINTLNNMLCLILYICHPSTIYFSTIKAKSVTWPEGWLQTGRLSIKYGVQYVIMIMTEIILLTRSNNSHYTVTAIVCS